MGSDAIGLMDVLKIDRAHVLGISMGGMIGQVLAAKHRERLRSLTSIMSSSGAMRFSFHMSPATRALLSPPPRHATEAQILDHTEHIWMLIGSPGLQPPRDILRERLRQSMQRAYNPAGVARQMLAIMASGDRRRLLRTIETPTLVIHGDRDTLVPIAAGRDTAANIPGASFREVAGMGHDLPEPLRQRVTGLGGSLFCTFDVDDGDASVLRIVTGIDPRTGAVGIAERPHVGAEVAFSLRDQDAARGDLEESLAALDEALGPRRPLAFVVFSSTARDNGLFGVPLWDVTRVLSRFGPDVPVVGCSSRLEVATFGRQTLAFSQSVVVAAVLPAA
jgi:hypothetical protein